MYSTSTDSCIISMFLVMLMPGHGHGHRTWAWNFTRMYSILLSRNYVCHLMVNYKLLRNSNNLKISRDYQERRIWGN